MYIFGDHIAEAVTEFNACIVLLGDRDFVKMAKAVDVDGDSAAHFLQGVAFEEDDPTKTLPYVFLIGVIAARKAMNPTDAEKQELAE
jgi:hypothetical protein